MTGSIELQFEDGTGAWRYIEVKFTNLLQEPGVDGVVVTTHDINERKVFERQLERQAFHELVDGVAKPGPVLRSPESRARPGRPPAE